MTSLELNLIYEQCERIRQAVELLWNPAWICAGCFVVCVADVAWCRIREWRASR